MTINLRSLLPMNLARFHLSTTTVTPLFKLWFIYEIDGNFPNPWVLPPWLSFLSVYFFHVISPGIQCISSHFQDSVTVHQKIRPKDVPGTLLNMALLNLGSSDPNLRTAAYNQLCALTATFDLKIEVGQLLNPVPQSKIHSRSFVLVEKKLDSLYRDNCWRRGVYVYLPIIRYSSKACLRN